MIINDIYINDEHIYSKSINEKYSQDNYRSGFLHSSDFMYILAPDYTLYHFNDDLDNIEIILDADSICDHIFNEYKILGTRYNSEYREEIKSFMFGLKDAPDRIIDEILRNYIKNLKTIYSLYQTTSYSSIYNFSIEITSTFGKSQEYNVKNLVFCLASCIKNNNVKYFKQRPIELEKLRKELFNKYILPNKPDKFKL